MAAPHEPVAYSWTVADTSDYHPDRLFWEGSSPIGWHCDSVEGDEDGALWVLLANKQLVVVRPLTAERRAAREALRLARST